MARLSHHDRAVRSGVVLLIVMAMLALFAVVGLSFVFYAESEKEGARLIRQSADLDLADALPEKLMSYALGQLIYGPNNPNWAMLGHSLAESIYGSPGGTVPFNGIGRPHPDTKTTLPGLRPFAGINVPYTYPDINNPFLATIDANGMIQERSFYRNGSSLRPATLPKTNQFNAAEGDVRNIESSMGVKGGLFNDAFWMDLAYPIQTPKEGTRVKPLFTFTILDLDSRVNLAVVGNFLADYNTPGVTSRCGLGTYEINPLKVLPLGAEISKLFRGSATPPSRFGTGANDTPDQSALMTFAPTKPYSRIDYSGISSGMPAQPTARFSHFPTFNNWTDPVASAPHPAAFDYFNSGRTPVNPTDDFRLAASNAEGILRWRDRGSPALTSDLFRLLTDNLNPQRSGAAQLLNLITPYSMSLDTAQLAPFIVRNANYKYELARDQANNVDAPYPKANSLTQNVPTAQAAAAGTGDDFSPDFRSRAAGELRRLNLNRGLFNNPSSQPGRYLQDRAVMAKDIFDRLVRVTGALPPSANSPFQPANVNDTQYKATRWLAQLAVNMVDFMDEDDDNMTVFNWNPKANAGQQEAGDYVVGIELNRLLINEVYASFDNDKNDPGLTAGAPPNSAKYRINVWAELYNPVSNMLSNAGRATLISTNNQPRYRLLLAKDAAGIADSPTGMPTTLHYANAGDPTQGVDDWPSGAKASVRAGDQSPGGNNAPGFYLVAPPDNTFLQGAKPSWATVTWDHNSSGMASKLYNLPAKGDPTDSVTLVLQRLADINRDEQPDPKQPNYNPFVTVDYFANVTPNNNIRQIGPGPAPAPSPPPIGSSSAKGRFQPLQATQPRDQTPAKANDKMGSEPQHTFGLQNVPGKNPFNAYYHLDRALISSAEILMTPAMAPSQFTQRFAATTPNSLFVVYDACKDPNSLLYRFLETVTTGDRMYNRDLARFNNKMSTDLQTGAPAADPTPPPAGWGRHAIFVPGKINLNTVFDKRVIQALFDRQKDNSFVKETDVDAFWDDLQRIRNTRPIAGFSDYTLTDAGGGNQNVTITNTLFQDQNLFQKLYQTSTGVSEYEKADALRKVMNNITFTSNAFAVWVTVGFFEVDANNNVTQEIGKYENRNVRHRMFAIVDRSQLVIPDQTLTELTSAANKASTTFTVKSTSGNVNPVSSTIKVAYPSWTLKSGMLLTIDKDRPNEETVMAKIVNGNTVEVYESFRQNHVVGATVHLGGIGGPQVPLNAGNNNFLLGYPGPQPNFSLRDYTYVVPYYSVID